MKVCTASVMLLLAWSTAMFAQEAQLRRANHIRYPDAPSVVYAHTRARGYVPLSPIEKFEIFKDNTYSLGTIGGAGVGAILDQTLARHDGYAGGIPGTAQRFAIYQASGESRVFFSSYLLPVLLKQDPRYFRLAEGSKWKRTWHAFRAIAVTRTDCGGQSFNVSHVGGAVLSETLANAYLPQRYVNLGDTANRVGIGLAVDAGWNVFQEFWPDVRGHLSRKRMGKPLVKATEAAAGWGIQPVPEEPR